MSKNITIKIKLPKSKKSKKGMTGVPGPMGPMGNMGIMGQTGPEGPRGLQGEPGRVDANTLLDVIETDTRVQEAIKALFTLPQQQPEPSVIQS